MALPLATRPAAAEQPSTKWRTLETQHFRLHYPVGFEVWAQRAAGAIEPIHAEVVRYVGFTPTTRVDVIIEDPVALPNGLALALLDRPVIILWTSPPTSDSPIGSFADWPQFVLTHEFAHIAHLTRPRNDSWRILRYLTPVPSGPLNLWAPRWVKEGYATVVEGALTGSGRPPSSFRAMVLRQFAIEGKLPAYGQLSATRGWLAGTMAYVAGSAFLEWLEAREGTDTLPQLWTRLTSRKPMFFSSGFRSVYGRAPRDLYDRFRAELTARALTEEKQLEDAGLVHGDLWQRFEGGVSAPHVSPSGDRLLARREPNRGDPYLAIWPIAETDAERQEEARRGAREARRLQDPAEGPDRPELPRRRKPGWRLPAINGSAPADPRWMPDGRGVLFSRRSPDRDGVLHWDVALWQPETGAVRQVTRLADVSMADPMPDGRRAIAVRTRFGLSELVVVDLESGRVALVVARDDEAIWSYPRVSPDGSTIVALLHRDARWRVVRISATGTGLTEIAVAGAPIGPPAWGADSSRIYVTTDASGIWNIHSAEAGAPGSDRTLTRVTGGAAAPAPAPDGRSIFFLELTAQGIDIRRVNTAQTVLPGPQPATDAFPILPPVSLTPIRFPSSALAAARPYRPWSTLTVRPIVSSTTGLDRSTRQIGAQATDVLGQLNWLTLVSFSRQPSVSVEGAATAFAYRGFPVALVAHGFVATERPGRQTLAPRPELDRRRVGGAFSGSWKRAMSSGSLSADAGLGLTSVESLSDGREFGRRLAFSEIQANWWRRRGPTGVEAGVRLQDAVGKTDGDVWRQALLQGQVGARSSGGRILFTGRYGNTGGAPGRFDLFAIGGAPSSLVPPALDLNRVYALGLPPFLQVGRRTATVRAEYVTPRAPIGIYLERLGAWDPGTPKPPFAEAAGVELRIEDRGLRSTLLHMPGTLSFYIGTARLRSAAPSVRATRRYFGLVYRP